MTNEVSHQKSSPYNLRELSCFFEVFYKKLEACAGAEKMSIGSVFFFKKR